MVRDAEKDEAAADDSFSSGLETEFVPEWEYSEELRARRKVDNSVLPLLFLGLLVFQLDRMNLASALTGGLAADIGITQSDVNLGNQLMFLFIVVLEIPSNVILQRLGPRIWISAQVVLFGLMATLQATVQSRGGFLAIKALLGVAETGYIPGGVFTLASWYTRGELAKRVAFFFFGMFGGNAVSPLLGGAILKLEGHQGLRGWQWIFIIEGVFTITVGLSLFFILPGSPDQPRPLISPGLVRFTPREQEILQRRLQLDDSARRPGAHGMKLKLDLIRKTVLHYRRWPHFISTGLVFATWSPLTTYTPTIIVSLGFDRIRANALAAIGALMALPVVFVFAWISDRTNKRGFTVMGAQALYLVVLIIARSIQHDVGIWSKWGLWTAVNAMSVGYHPIHNTWIQLNTNSPGERSISIAMWVMSAISGLMAGTQIFQQDDAPDYDNGLRTMIICVTLGIFFAGIQEVIYLHHNGNVSRGKAHVEKGASEPRTYTP